MAAVAIEVVVFDRLRNAVDPGAWLDDNGGFCDCEVLANCEQNFDDAMHDEL